MMIDNYRRCLPSHPIKWDKKIAEPPIQNKQFPYLTVFSSLLILGMSEKKFLIDLGLFVLLFHT